MSVVYKAYFASSDSTIPVIEAMICIQYAIVLLLAYYKLPFNLRIIFHDITFSFSSSQPK